MLNRNTKIFVVISAIFLIVSIVASGIFFTMVTKQKEVYTTHTIERAQNKLHKESLQSLMRTLEDTQSERKLLMSRVLKDDEVINFLSLIEALGKERGVTLTTNSLVVFPLTNTFEKLVVDIGLEGSYSEVVYMLKLLEQLPYQSTIDTVKITREEGESSSRWDGSLKVNVTKLKNHAN